MTLKEQIMKLQTYKMYEGEDTVYVERNDVLKALEQQSCEDCISRTALLSRIDAERKHLLDIKMDGAEHIIVHHARRIIEDMPSVTPQSCEEENPNCTECRYYDHEKHHCPRFCKVIENTMAEITSEQTRWIPCSERLPDKENEYLVTTYCGGKYDVETSWWWIYSEGHSEWGEYGVIAWMPLPTSYQGEENG